MVIQHLAQLVAQKIHPLHAFTGTVLHFMQKLVLLAILHVHALETVYSDYSTDYDVATPASLCKVNWEVGATCGTGTESSCWEQRNPSTS